MKAHKNGGSKKKEEERFKKERRRNQEVLKEGKIRSKGTGNVGRSEKEVGKKRGGKSKKKGQNPKTPEKQNPPSLQRYPW